MYTQVEPSVMWITTSGITHDNVDLAIGTCRLCVHVRKKREQLTKKQK